ncbi:kelch repeat-containing protein [Solimicrobium silvestre]|uniref:Galactose oxidase, central domain n=1 Tax=Solimicrobium silvestre TaxID=2099400 RepID=A0A2S9H529_9BURK|nr:kelch repeat-containing protein [Solimicrobium silvestre]PRC95089.1 Galactose oxidase, central domain [Solimicrobium silvestre]
MSAIKVNRVLIAAAVAVFLLVGCKGKGSSSSSSIPASLTNWTWEAGTNVANSIGSAGAQGVPSALNQPAGRSGSMNWQDTKGQFWVFGGSGVNNSIYNDMWVLSPSTLQWTWMAGSTSGTTTGTATTTNAPGSRNSAATWMDASGNFWMFGGYGTDSNGLTGYLCDMWMFNPTTNTWTSEGGSPTGGGSASPAPSFGTINVPATSNLPNPRSNAAYWTETNPTTGAITFWMFGGQGYLNNTSGVQNDLWTFNPSTKEWTWVGGSSTLLNVAGIYGTAGTPAATNQPGSRQSATTWTQTTAGVTTLWMFGGTGIDGSTISLNGQLNDLWSFNTSTGVWTWVNNGTNPTNVANSIGVYGTNDVAAPTNVPGGRSGATGWTDTSGNRWLFGGYGINSSGTLTILNDLWEFQINSTGGGQWVWINGSYNGSATGYYGSPGVLSSSNMPGSRYAASGWTDSAGNFWLFGGTGFDAAGVNGRLSDMWKFVP